jgi:probable HAF family extracellular repeat protein
MLACRSAVFLQQKTSPCNQREFPQPPEHLKSRTGESDSLATMQKGFQRFTGSGHAGLRSLVFLFCIVFVFSAHAASGPYRLKRLPSPRGSAMTRADSINNNGEVLIDAVTRSGSAQAAILRGKQFTFIGSVPGLTNTFGQRIGDSGIVIGSSANADSAQETFFYYDGVVHSITSDEGFVQLLGVTSDGVVLGTIDSSQPFLATNGVITFLDLPNAFPLAINNAGVLAGTVNVITNSQFQLRAAVFVGTNVTRIPTESIASGNSAATALNDAGHVVGVVSSNGVNRGFLFRDGELFDLGLLDGWDRLTPMAINSQDQIVGFAGHSGDSATNTAFIWNAGQLTDFSPLIAKRKGTIISGQTIDINDAGSIVMTLIKKGRSRAVLLTPRTAVQ